jgi:hypothetical protein
VATLVAAFYGTQSARGLVSAGIPQRPPKAGGDVVVVVRGLAAVVEHGRPAA